MAPMYSLFFKQSTRTDLIEVRPSPSAELIYFVQCTVQYTMQCTVHYSVQCRLECHFLEFFGTMVLDIH